MQITIVTVNYNGSESTLELLRSLEEQTNKDFQTIVVDNASEEADFTTLQANISKFNFHISTVRNSENLGFSGGNNNGIRQALDPSTRSGQETGPEWVIFLNNDTWVESSFVEHLKAKLSGLEGIVGIPLVEGDKVAYCGKVQWLKSTLKHVYQKFTINLLPTTYYIIGGGMAVHKDVFNKIGFLDEKYFLYFEDADFSVRARKAKIPISIQYDIMIYHTVSASTKKLGSSLLLRYHYRNALYFNLKNGPWYIKLLVWPWSWVIIVKQLVKLAMRKNVDQSRAILAGVMNFYQNKYGKI